MKHSVVVVDDENDILRILAEVLLTSGYKPVTFWDAASAYAYVLRHKPALVITDLRMPGMSGQELIARLREQCGDDLPIVVMSASVSSAAITELPIQVFLSKPFDLDDFLGSVEKLLEVPQQCKVTSSR